MDEVKGIKHDSNKLRMDLLPVVALEEIAKVLSFGAEKYQPYNWAKGISYSRLIAAALRHLFAWSKGEDIDKETNLSHLAHAGCCIMFLLHLEKIKPEFDDRFKIQ